MEDSFEPVGQYYNAVSPDESVTSAHEMTDGHFRSLYNVETVGHLGDFLAGNNNTSSPEVPQAPVGWTKRVTDAFLDTQSFEDHMNAILQEALTEADVVTGLRAEETNKQNENENPTSQGETKVFSEPSL